MKKIILSVAICTIALIACNKKQINTIAPEASSTVQTPSNQNSRPSPYRVFFTNGPAGAYYCASTGGNCYPDVVISSAEKAVFKNVFAVLNSNNPIAIRNVFTNHQTVLSQYIDNDVLARAINGEYNVSSKENIQNETRFIVFTDAVKQSVEAVYPIIK